MTEDTAQPAQTPLDTAHLTAERSGSDRDRLAFWNCLAEAELHLLLTSEAGDVITPQLFEVEGMRYALAFDLPERLTAFTGDIAANATLSGRQLARLLAGEGLGLGLNLDDAPSAQLLPPDALRWLADTLAHAPREEAHQISEVAPPGTLPDALLTALDGKLSLTAGLAEAAYLAQVTYGDGSRSHILAFVDAVPGAEPDLARAMSEALVFSGVDAGQLDVMFLRASQPIAASVARHGLKIALPAPAAPDGPKAPGSDGPPRLR